MIETYQLEYFVEAATRGSILKASEALNVSQPSLSRGISKFEEELGLKLFDRSKNKATLNENGKAVLEVCLSVLGSLEALERKAKELRENVFSLKISSVAPGPYFKYPRLFMPRGKTSVTSCIKEEGEIVKGLLNGSFDIGFLNRQIEDPELECSYAFSESLYLYLPKSHFLLGMKDGVYFKDADGQSFLLSENLGVWDPLVRKMMPSSKFYTQAVDNLQEIIDSSIIPAFVTDVTLNNRTNENRLPLKLLDKEAKMDFYLCYKKGKKERLKEALSLIV